MKLRQRLLLVTGVSAFIFLCASSASGQKIEELPLTSDSSYQADLLHKKYSLRFFPIALAGGQLGDYCMEYRLVFEERLVNNNSFQVSVAGDMPGAGEIGPAIIGGLNGTPAPAYFGGRATFEFRHYYKLRKPNRLLSPFIGGGVSLNYMRGLERNDLYNDGRSLYAIWGSPPNIARLIMSSYYFSAGCQTIKIKRKYVGKVMLPEERRRILYTNDLPDKEIRVNHEQKQKDLLIDVGATIGYRFDYFWRHYPGLGNLEFEQTSLYRWYKTVPVCATINLSIGGVF